VVDLLARQSNRQLFAAIFSRAGIAGGCSGCFGRLITPTSMALVFFSEILLRKRCASSQQ
jgi:hypothetical protein